MVWSIRTLFGALLCGIALMLSAPAIAASPSNDALITEIEEFLRSSASKPTLAASSDERHPSIDFANALHIAIVNNDRVALDRLVGEIGAWSGKTRSTRSKLLHDVAKGIFERFPDDVYSPAKQPLVEFLEDFEARGDWYVQARVDLILTGLYLPNRNNLASVQYAQRAIAALPDEVSPWTTDIKMGSAESSISFYGIRGDARGMLKAAQAHAELTRHYDMPIDRFEFLTNLVFAFNATRDFETADRVAELLEGEVQSDAFPIGLDKINWGRTKIELGQYEAAAKLLKEAMVTAENPSVKRHASAFLATAYAGLGEPGEALKLLRDLEQQNSELNIPQSANARAVMLHTQALLALDAGDSEKALRLMQERVNILIAATKTANSSELTTLLANLENTRERQIERSEALRREAELKAVQLEQQKTINRALLALLAGLGAAIIALIFFLRYREKTNAQVQALQIQALSAEKMKTEFLGLINHELRTPLNAVIGISDAMINHSADAAIQAQAQAIQDSGEQLFDLLESLIDMSTIEADKMELAPDETDLSAMLREEAERWNRWADEKSLDYTQFIAPELNRFVIADATRIRQCAKFLLANAMRFTHSGRVHMHATGFVAADGNFDFCLIVADTGQGISEAVQAELFKPFVQADATMTRKYGGAGLSLSIARKLARMMGGDVSVKSVEGRGSEFTLTARLGLPAVAEAIAAPDMEMAAVPAKTIEPAVIAPAPLPIEAETATLASSTVASPMAAADPVIAKTPMTVAPSEAPPGSYEAELIDLMVAAPMFDDVIEPLPARAVRERDGLNGLSVLVVEDLPSNQDVIKLMLEPAGVDCIEALSGAEALRILAARSVDAVIMDIRMPGMNGLETTRHIRDMPGVKGQLPIIVLSADSAGTAANNAVAAGADAFLSKPVMRTKLIGALNRALDQKQAAPKSAAG